MTNLTKLKRDRMIEFLEELKSNNSDDESIRALNEIKNALTEKKFGLVFEEHEEEVDERLKKEIPIFCADETRKICKDKNLPYNFIIEGDNLQALYLLEKTHRGKIDCIYIDPPFNSGARDWKYNNDYVDANDNYKHSKWLSMMKTRLKIAKKLLNPENSVLICAIDEKEFLHLGCLLEELFSEGNMQMVSTVINRAGTGRQHEFSRTDEYLFFIRFGNATIAMNQLEGKSTPVTWDTLRRSGPTNTRDKTKRQFYPVFVNDDTKKIEHVGHPIPLEMDINDVETPEGCTAVFPIRDNGLEMMWGCVREEFLNRLNRGYIRVGQHKPNKPQKYVISYLTKGIINDIESGKAYIESYNENGSVNAFYKGNREIPPTTNWKKPLHDAQWYGSKLIKQIFGLNKFPYPKSLYAIKDCINYVTKNKKDAIILDFFAGSGTTMNAVNLLNAEDGGNRKCIMVTNNELSEDDAKKLKKEGFKPGDEEWENLGIAKSITWPRTYCVINGIDIKGKPLEGNYEISNIPMSEGFNTNVKYLKCDWTPRKPFDYLLSDVLLSHIKEMIELEYFIEIDDEKYVVILNKDDFNNYILNEKIYSKIKKLWVNQSIIFTSEEIELLKTKEFRYIPKEYFGQELKEVAE